MKLWQSKKHKFPKLLLRLEEYADHYDMQVLAIDSFQDLDDDALEEAPYLGNIIVDAYGIICIPEDAP